MSVASTSKLHAAPERRRYLSPTFSFVKRTNCNSSLPGCSFRRRGCEACSSAGDRESGSTCRDAEAVANVSSPELRTTNCGRDQKMSKREIVDAVVKRLYPSTEPRFRTASRVDHRRISTNQTPCSCKPRSRRRPLLNTSNDTRTPLTNLNDQLSNSSPTYQSSIAWHLPAKCQKIPSSDDGTGPSSLPPAVTPRCRLGKSGVEKFSLVQNQEASMSDDSLDACVQQSARSATFDMDSLEAVRSLCDHCCLK